MEKTKTQQKLKSKQVLHGLADFKDHI